jgi:small subunit ribosomal protein S6
MTEYETLYLLLPDLPNEKVEEFNRKIEELIKSHQGQVLAVFNFGKRKLAYRVGKTFQGIYVHFNYLGQGNLVAEVERVLKYDDTVLKFITVKLADEVKPEDRAKEKKEFILCTYDEANDRAA